MTSLIEARYQASELKVAHSKSLAETGRTPRIYQLYRGRKATGSYGIRFELTPANPVVEEGGSPFRRTAR
jgi:hypothetical protein